MLQWLRAIAALAKDPSLVPSTHIRQPPTAYNSSSRGSQHSLLPTLGTKNANACMSLHTHINRHTPKQPLLGILVSTTLKDNHTLTCLPEKLPAALKAHLLDEDNLSQLNYNLPEPHYILK